MHASSFKLKSDKDLRIGLRKTFTKIKNESLFTHPIIVELPILWISAHSLNILLIFIESIYILNPKAEIHITLFPENIVSMIKKRAIKHPKYKIYCERVKQKIVFYKTMRLLEHLEVMGVKIKPNSIDDLTYYLDATPQKSDFLSSRILALNPLIENEAEQHELTNRMQTMISILNRNLRGRLDPGEAKEKSAQIMFELVKNIYQHSGVQSYKFRSSSGFACAQINKYILINNPKYPIDLCKSVIRYYFTEQEKARWGMLTISVNDFGVGITKKVRENHSINHTTNSLNTPEELLLLALTTDFSTKQLSGLDDLPLFKVAKEKFGDVNLENKGYGLIYCMGFIALQFGRLSIRSESVEMQIFAKPNALELDPLLWRNTNSVINLLKTNFNNYFDIITKTLSPDETQFPGTQIIIEIPVQTFSYNS